MADVNLTINTSPVKLAIASGLTTPNDLSIATAAPSTINGISGLSITIPNVLAAPNEINAAWWGVVSNTPSAAASNSLIINALMAGLAARGGGKLRLPWGAVYIAGLLDNKYPGVRVLGWKLDGSSDTAAGNAVVGTQFVATLTGTMAKLRTPFASEQGLPASQCYANYGSGFEDVSFNGGGIATKALDIISVRFAKVDIYYDNFAGTGPRVTTNAGVTGTDLGDACDISHSTIIVRGRMIDTTADQASTGFQANGSINANTCFNHIRIWVEYDNGLVFEGVSCDNNEIWIKGDREAGGTGALVLAHGTTAAVATGCDGNLFTRITGAGAISATGTDTSGVTSGVHNVILALDTANATPVPTQGVGSGWTFGTSQGYMGGGSSGPTAFADNYVNGAAQKALIASETMRVYNASANHILLTDGTNTWGINIDPGTGNLRLAQIGGTSGGVIESGFMLTAGFAYASLPAASSHKGARSFVTDSTVVAAGNFGAAVATGGGSNFVAVYSDGVNWRIG